VTDQEFERLLDAVVKRLTEEAQQSKFTTSKVFENRVRDILQEEGSQFAITVNYDPHPFVFPDIAIGSFGVEVKFSEKETWRSVANSVFETFRNQDVLHVYVVFGKMGGLPEVRWGRYSDCVIHVRTSHVPRFELDMSPVSSLFKTFGITYEEFCALSESEKMVYIRQYARGRLKNGEHLWWLEDNPEQEHSLSVNPRLYMNLSTTEKRRLRAEVTLLCPQVVAGSRVRNKYNEPAMFLLTYHGVLCPQTRDLFSAGSVAMASDDARGGIYVQRALTEIESEMIIASLEMDDALFVEYWHESVPPAQRIEKWLVKADALAQGWVPSEVLFKAKMSG
jgi:hypothetical protein